MTNHVQPSAQSSQSTEKPDEKAAPIGDEQKPAPVKSPAEPAPAAKP